MSGHAAQYGSFRRSLFSLEFVDALTGDRTRVPKADLSPEGQKQIRSLPKNFTGWIFRSGHGSAHYRSDATSLPDGVLLETISAVASCVRDWHVFSPSTELVNSMLRELLSHPGLTDESKVSLLVLPWMAHHHDAYMAALDHSIYPKLRQALRLDDHWRDTSRSLPEELVALSEWLLDPAELVDWKEARAKAEEEKRAREETERRRVEEERERERIRREEQARVRAERTEAFRRALAAGHGQGEEPEPVMTEEFQRVFDVIESDVKLLFVTGKPGTGKSTLVRALKDRLSGKNYAVLSFTGAAALNVGGQTINSFFGMPLHFLELNWQQDRRSFIAKAQALEVVVVDEVSMLRPDMLDAMDSSLRAARGDPRPFGGVQLVLVGDLFQLPPVLGSDPAVLEHFRRVYQGERFFLAAHALRANRPCVVELTRVFRQKEEAFLSLLARIREGTITGKELDGFNRTCRRYPDFAPNEFHMIVTPRRATAAHFNQQQLDSLPGAARTYAARFTGAVPEADQIEETARNRYPADIQLELKSLAQIVFVKNDDGKHWVNGDLGIVEDLSDDWVKVTTRSGTWRVERVTWPLVRYEIDPHSHRLVAHEYGSFTQFPLRLAWASTIHKMQGQTVDRIRIDLTGGAFEAGMTYVALSRCRTMGGIRLTRPLVLADLIVDPEIARHMKSLPPCQQGSTNHSQ